MTSALATAVSASGTGFLAGSATAGPFPDAGLVALLAIGVLAVMLTVRFRRPLAPVGTAALVLLTLAAVPGTRTAALLLLAPVLAMLGAGLADRALPRDRPARAGAVLAVTVLVLLAATGPLLSAAASVTGPDRVAAPLPGDASEVATPVFGVAPTGG